MLTLAQMYAVTFIAGALSVLFTVSDGTLFVSIVAPDPYVDGQSLIYGSRAFSFMGGPSVGGLLVEALTAPFAIIADALSFLGSAVQLAAIKPAEPPSSDGEDGVTAGLRFVARSPIIRASLTGVAVINFFNMMFSALFMLYAVRELHVRPGVLGVVIGAGAVGGMIASLTAKRLGNRLGIGLVYVAGASSSRSAGAGAAGRQRARRGGAADAVRGRVRERVRGDGARHLDRRDLRDGHPGHDAVAGVGRVPGDQLRHPAGRRAARRGARRRGGLRPALWVAVAGGVAGALLLLPSPLPGFRMPEPPASSRTRAV